MQMKISLADVTPDFVHPQTQKSLETMAKEISGQEDLTSFFSTVQEEDYLGKLYKYRENASSGKPRYLLKDGNAEISTSMCNGSLLTTEIFLGRDTSELEASGQNGANLSGLANSFSVLCLGTSSDHFGDAGHQLSGNSRRGKISLSNKCLSVRVAPVALR